MAEYFDPFPGNRGDELGNFNKAYRTQPHRGSDWGKKAAIGGKPVKAITTGRVKDIFWTDALGWCLTQGSADGIVWEYSHLFPKPIIEIGTMVIGGKTAVGKVGGGASRPSGSSSTGDHLHMSGCLATDGARPHEVAREKLLDVHAHIDANPPVKK
jgi:murein DD-endopeptidase MepM/ murein hydrolase activator NlpD